MAVTLEMASQVTTQIPCYGMVLQLHTGMVPSEVNIQTLISFLSLPTALLDAEKSLLLFALATDSAFTTTAPGSLWRNADCKQHLGAFFTS